MPAGAGTGRAKVADMVDRIYTMQEGEMTPLASRAFESEAELQELIAAYPELIAWEQIRPGRLCGGYS